MSSKYPESVEAHVRELGRDFHNALVSTQGVRTQAPISQHVSNSIRSGIRKGFAEALSQDRCVILHSKKAKNEVKDMIHSQICSALSGPSQASVTSDGVPRATLKSLYASFLNLSHKYKVDLGANMQFAGTDEHTIPAPLAETGLKLEDRSSPPPSRQQKGNSPILNKANDNTIVVSLSDDLIDPGMNDMELTRLVNQSIGSDPEIPSHLRDSKWITGATLLDSGEIEVHTETEDDRDFLALNTHWRPKLAQTLAARKKTFTEAMDQFPFQEFDSTLRAHEDDVRAVHQEPDMTESKAPIPIITPSSRPEQAGRAFKAESPWSSDYRPLPSTNHQKDCPPTVPAQSYIPHQGTDISNKPNMNASYLSLARAQLLELTTDRETALTEQTIGNKKRAAGFSSDFPCSDEGTKRMRIGMEE